MCDKEVNGYIRAKWVLRGNRPVIENMTIALQKDDGFPKIISKVTSSSACKINRDCFDITPDDDWTNGLIKIKGDKQ